jgi:YbbR domain-containing protein
VRIEFAADTGSRSIPVGLTLLNARADRTYHLSATDAIVTLTGTVPALNELETRAVTATVDVGSIPPGPRTVNVGFTAPSGLQLVSINPTQVTVTVALPPTPPPTAAAATPPPTPGASPSGVP